MPPLQRFRAVTRRSEQPVAIPRTPPSFFVNAVSLAVVNALEMLAGALACARLVTASYNSSNASTSSDDTLMTTV